MEPVPTAAQGLLTYKFQANKKKMSLKTKENAQNLLQFCMIFNSERRVVAAWLAQLGERRSAEREVAGSNPGPTNTQGL